MGKYFSNKERRENCNINKDGNDREYLCDWRTTIRSLLSSDGYAFRRNVDLSASFYMRTTSRTFASCLSQSHEARMEYLHGFCCHRMAVHGSKNESFFLKRM